MQRDNKPLVSVIIPTHNRATIVPQAINSVLQQSFTDYELIVVDDASTDDTADRLQAGYGEKIKYIKKLSNAGPSAARNTGIQVARGIYIAFLDDDDEWLPEKLQLQLPIMKQNPDVGVVYCGCFLVDEGGAIAGQIKPEKRGYIFNDLLHKNYLITSAALIRKEILEKVGGFDESLAACEDWDLWIRISQQCLIEYVDELLLRYKVHKQNIHHDMQKMEKNTFMVLDKRLSDIDITARNKIYCEQSTFWAWEYYRAGNKSDFSRLLVQALRYCPLENNIFNYEGNLPEKETLFFEVFDEYWNRPQNEIAQARRRNAYAQQFQQLAWAYYHRDDLEGFRRCTIKVFKYSLPKIPIRLFISFIKSFLGKAVSEKIHNNRKRLTGV